jgi:hypothetical protein
MEGGKGGKLERKEKVKIKSLGLGRWERASS